MNFIHISDLHIHSDNSDNEKNQKLFENLLEYKNDHYLIITGDIVDDGLEAQYKNAVEFLKPFKDKIFLCPGNHDYGYLGNLYSKKSALLFDKYISKNFSQGGSFYKNNKPVLNIIGDKDKPVLIIALDSNLETYTPFDFACGKVGKKQLHYLEKILSTKKYSEMRKILLFHHHPFSRDEPFLRMKDAKKLVRLVYKKVDVILFGHRHIMGPPLGDEKKWSNCWGTEYIFASDNSPGKKFVRRITIKENKIKVNLLEMKY